MSLLYNHESYLCVFDGFVMQKTNFRFEAIVHDEHEKCGYKVEGILRDAVYKAGKYQNQYVLSLLKEER